MKVCHVRSRSSTTYGSPPQYGSARSTGSTMPTISTCSGAISSSQNGWRSRRSPRLSPLRCAVSAPITTGIAPAHPAAACGAELPATSWTCCSIPSRKRRFARGRSSSSASNMPPGPEGKKVALLPWRMTSSSEERNEAATAASIRCREASYDSGRMLTLPCVIWTSSSVRSEASNAKSRPRSRIASA